MGGWAAAIHRCPRPYSRNLSICCLTWQRGFAGVIKWRIVSGRKHPGWFRWAQWGHGVLSRWMQKGQSQKEMEGWKQRSGERRLLVWKQRKEPQCKECWQSLEAEGDYEVKVKKCILPKKEHNILVSTQCDPFPTSDLQRIDFCWFKSLSLW